MSAATALASSRRRRRSPRSFRAAVESGVRTVLDVVIPRPANYWPFLEPVLPWTDVFLPNNDEGETITGLKDPVAQAQCFRHAGAKSVIITCGGQGAVAACPAGTFRAGRFDVEPIDGTGSGDAFTAGYIHALLEGADVAGCVRTGSALEPAASARPARRPASLMRVSCPSF